MHLNLGRPFFFRGSERVLVSCGPSGTAFHTYLQDTAGGDVTSSAIWKPVIGSSTHGVLERPAARVSVATLTGTSGHGQVPYLSGLKIRDCKRNLLTGLGVPSKER